MRFLFEVLFDRFVCPISQYIIICLHRWGKTSILFAPSWRWFSTGLCWWIWRFFPCGFPPMSWSAAAWRGKWPSSSQRWLFSSWRHFSGVKGGEFSIRKTGRLEYCIESLYTYPVFYIISEYIYILCTLESFNIKIFMIIDANNC